VPWRIRSAAFSAAPDALAIVFTHPVLLMPKQQLLDPLGTLHSQRKAPCSASCSALRKTLRY